jgi:hypothetical protein
MIRYADRRDSFMIPATSSAVSISVTTYAPFPYKSVTLTPRASASFIALAIRGDIFPVSYLAIVT